MRTYGRKREEGIEGYPLENYYNADDLVSCSATICSDGLKNIGRDRMANSIDQYTHYALPRRRVEN